MLKCVLFIWGFIFVNAAAVSQGLREAKGAGLIMETKKQDVRLSPHPVEIGKQGFSLNIPEGFSISKAAEVGSRIRFMAFSPDGRLFVTDMHDLSDNRKGKVLVFDRWNEQFKRFDTVITYLDKLRNPNQVAFYKNYIYVAETHRLTRFEYGKGDKPLGEAEVICTFPDYGLSYKYGGWHLTRSIAFHQDKIYVSVGSSCNACVEKEEVRASVLEMDPDGKNQVHYARGLRNSVGIKWIGSSLYGTGMGRDLIGPDKPEDVFQEIKRGRFYGWPFYFQYKNKVYEDEQFRDSVKAPWVTAPPVALVGFKAHSAPLGFDHFKDFDDNRLKNAVLVCLHGSTSIWRQRGYSIVKLERDHSYTEIVSGFLTGKDEKARHGKPCDILMKDSRSFYFTDDHNGILYYVWK